MLAEANKALVHRWVEAWNNDTNTEVMDQIFARDWIDGNPLPGAPSGGLEGVEHFVKLFRHALPDARLSVEQIVADDEKVAFWWRASGTHQGEVFGIPPTGKHISFTGMTMHRVANGRFAESWAELDLMGLIQQLRTPEPSEA
jgi:steroid delta-isomerase-like uncharacterized protein